MPLQRRTEAKRISRHASSRAIDHRILGIITAYKFSRINVKVRFLHIQQCGLTIAHQSFYTHIPSPAYLQGVPGFITSPILHSSAVDVLVCQLRDRRGLECPFVLPVNHFSVSCDGIFFSNVLSENSTVLRAQRPETIGGRPSVCLTGMAYTSTSFLRYSHSVRPDMNCITALCWPNIPVLSRPSCI
ncbi:uncharacterized protein LAESUDRAFT_180699 [Laetiporus sulphureus 93-53]|uniref:Uncharacterized protein n=1 Tax=Laetiporus sulphureus 93-53 TaxID=1314785 RepID=A0A165E8Y2_9APHY|nr:uncharacterized protein LAESUDRAFT_180699 [Laetiporus sulphureus 93-53]KZT06493.1 hypothetical protein LAESUDRAFT_180699 [Laetiporus sulphureus 93-53]